MTGVTDMPFRTMVRRYGSGLNVTEMIASAGDAIRETRQSIQKAAWDPIEEPVSMQLVGCYARRNGRGRQASTRNAARRSSTSTWAARCKQGDRAAMPARR